MDNLLATINTLPDIDDSKKAEITALLTKNQLGECLEREIIPMFGLSQEVIENFGMKRNN